MALSRQERKRIKEELARARVHGIPIKKKRGIKFWFLSGDTVKTPDGEVITKAEFDERQLQVVNDIGWNEERTYDTRKDIMFVKDTGCLPLGTDPDIYNGTVTEPLPLLTKKQKKRLAKQQAQEQAQQPPVMALQEQPQTYRLIASVNAFSITDYGEVCDRMSDTINRNFNRR